MAKRKQVDTDNLDIGQAPARVLPSVGDAEFHMDDIEIVDSFRFKDAAKEAAFMEEFITVRLATTTDRNADPLPCVGVNGRMQYFVRGQSQVVRRKFVEVLARARKRTYHQEEYLDGNNNRAIRYVPTDAPEFPFQVIEDKNPIGAVWLKEILERPAA